MIIAPTLSSAGRVGASRSAVHKEWDGHHEDRTRTRIGHSVVGLAVGWDHGGYTGHVFQRMCGQFHLYKVRSMQATNTFYRGTYVCSNMYP